MNLKWAVRHRWSTNRSSASIVVIGTEEDVSKYNPQLTANYNDPWWINNWQDTRTCFTPLWSTSESQIGLNPPASAASNWRRLIESHHLNQHRFHLQWCTSFESQRMLLSGSWLTSALRYEYFKMIGRVIIPVSSYFLAFETMELAGSKSPLLLLLLPSSSSPPTSSNSHRIIRLHKLIYSIRNQMLCNGAT